jgi:hypothetical protein|tara:strand:+ start:2108 stop:2449 length:342 start_codon:yes stop_codon:yes gene_type:complete
MKEYYRPLPNSLKIGDSIIEGNGLFAKEDILKGTCLGLSHIYNVNFLNDYIRTPLGGFINYSDNPNCDNSNFGSDSQLELDDTRLNMYLWTSKNIKKGEELTLKYKLYNPTEL